MRSWRRVRDVTLFWKILVPFLGLVVLLGALGTLLVGQDLASRAQAVVEKELARRSLDAQSALRDRELYVLEAVNFASNIQGIDGAIRNHDLPETRKLLASVLALKTDLDLLTVTDVRGRAIAAFARSSEGSMEIARARDWSGEPLVQEALSDAGNRKAGFVDVDGSPLLVVVGPVCSEPRGCGASGIAIAGLSARNIATEALVRSLPTSATGEPGAGVTIFAPDGTVIAHAGAESPHPPQRKRALDARRTSGAGAEEIETLYAALSMGGTNARTIAVSILRRPAFASVRVAAYRLALIVLGGMVTVVALGALVSRFILTRVRRLLEAHRSLARGELSTRVEVGSRDEIGELALGLNHMAQELQASHDTLEAKVQDRTREVQRLLRQRSDFFAALSHEFRTPLGVILSEADLLADPRHKPTAASVRRAARAQRAAGAQLLSAINEILQLAEADSGNLEIALEEGHLRDIIDELRPTIEGLASVNGIELKLAVARDLPPVIVDRSRIRDVILNLVDNSVKYTPAGGFVEVTAAAYNGTIEISVADNGLGIPPDLGARIFEPFVRVNGVKPLHGQASSGLGLALAKRFVEAQGGSISYATRPGGGTVFTVALVRTNGAGLAHPRDDHPLDL